MDNRIYLICYINKFDKAKIQELLNLDANIVIASFIRLPSYDYKIDDLVDYIKNLPTKYPWKIHDIVEEDYPEPLVMDVVLDTSIRKNNSEYIYFFNAIDNCNLDTINKNTEIIINNRDNFGAIVDKENTYKNFATSFTNFVILNKNKNNEHLIDKIRENKSMTLHEV